MYQRLIKFSIFNLLVTSNIKKAVSGVIHNPHINKSSFRTYQETDLCYRQCNIACLKRFSTYTEQAELCWEGSNHDIMLKRLESALLDCKDYEVWAVFSKFKSLYGFPPPAVLSKVISGLSYSSDHRSLPKVCNLVFKIAKENTESLQHDSLSRLCLSLGRAQMPVLASKVIRLMVQRNSAPPVDVLCSVFMHMVKTEAGECLASNTLLEICDLFHHLSAKRSECAMLMKPSTTIFNLILEACVRSGSSLKGNKIIEAMARIRVVADVHSVLLFTYIYEMNGLRDELKKFKEYVDRVSLPLSRHYVQFYDKLLSLHYDFDDLDAAARLVADIYLLWGSRPQHPTEDLMKPCQVPIGPPYLKEGLKVQVMFELLQKDFVVHAKGKEEYVVLENGKLVLTSKGWARLIIKYKKRERISELSELIAAIQKKTGSDQEGSLCRDVIHACIYSGCLETAHDILDDMEMANMSVPTSTYMLLLNAYCRKNMSKEAEALVKQIKRIGLLINASDEMMVSNCITGVLNGSVVEPITGRQSELTEYLVQEMNGEYKSSSKVYELNSSMYFFCKAKMMEDAQTIYRKMQELNIPPTVQTFAYLVEGYLSLEMYRENTILWGDIKRFMYHGCSLANRDLYELLLLNFLRGGYFERVLDVLCCMKEQAMYTDRWMYKQEFIRLHKNLYRRLKAADATTEAQRLRLEHVKAFRMWVRNN
ncbi:hypothetical protein SOVF_028120 [Spinacia oleracea]|uniref:Pentatricopeptide repeat-containing protein At4g17616 n=1 Tax=Spinacia oleracea TaxID=3562 RepID=A0A9R0I2Q5_SPIOL|nr:pentatricopeptide repeat-containing protein At4g17616 [Spinacia oleracea]XP_056687496.1 pentatricopeptide repeat-containing protein At4g17616 [Spinacia oleracea]KNA23089.1 hypothetical protein SOVF_028120 [Spinacia oleracea]